MKVRESGMPEQDQWEAFFDPELILDELGLTAACADVVEFGCGYGTFTLAAASRIRGTLHALDVEVEILAAAAARATECGLPNIEFTLRDFVIDGSGLPDSSVDYAMLFNILHCEHPVGLLREAWRTLTAGGTLGIVHWNHDDETPRGPPMAIRPRPEQCRQWAEEAGFGSVGQVRNLPPHHYGMTLRKPDRG
jgi:SAM-dependent methyltransferase